MPSNTKEYARKYYRNNKREKLDSNKRWSKKRRDENRAKINQIKESTPCADCGAILPAVCMDFDHLRDKKFNISETNLIRQPWESVMKEMNKCEIVCANCHRIRTRDRGQWSHTD